MTSIQSTESAEITQTSPIIYCVILLLIYGINLLLSFFRPILNLFVMYLEIDWAEFQFLEYFDIFNMVFGGLLIVFAFCLISYKNLKRVVSIFGGGLLLLYSLLNPSHLLIFISIISVLLGAPPIWMQVIPENLLVVYLSSWTLVSISNIVLQGFGIFIAFRIMLKADPRKSLIQFLFFYCWVLSISGITLLLQSLLILSLTGTWSSLAVAPYIFALATWITMIISGISGILFIRFWPHEPAPLSHVRLGQIALLAFSIMYLVVSFSDFAMKEIFSLVLGCLFAGVLVLFALKIPQFLQEKKIVSIKNRPV
ncbi:MAG: hypothetical protein LUQ65_09735 [Candidatus Helarchaeota archaeon]|nr:hypothetical protein [Candidatus Helarchaeota archaeon]